MTEFEKIIAQERARHELMQSPMAPVVHPKVRAYEGQPMPEQIVLTVSDREVAARAVVDHMRSTSEKVHKAIGRDLYLQFLYMSQICTTIVGYLTGIIQHMCDTYSTHTRRLDAILAEMVEACNNMYGRLSRNSNSYVEAVKCMRRHFMEDGGFLRHIEMLKEQYRFALMASATHHTREDDVDLLAWCYAAMALAEESYTYDKYIQGIYNSRIKTARDKMIMHSFRSQDTYLGHKVLAKFLKYWECPATLDSPNIQSARKVVQTQMRIAKISEWHDMEKRALELEGKTIQIA